MVTGASRPAVLNTSAPEAADRDLVQTARDGNRSAFGVLYERFKPMVHGILLSYVRHCDAEDLLQTVFLRAMQRLAHLRDADAFGGWLAAMARHAAVDFHRQHRNLVEIIEMAGHSDGSVDASEALAAIRSLPEAYRETLIFRLVEGMTGPEIAARTHLTPESVRVNLCRGMKMLRAKLNEKGMA
jgi:RNA polymerase sigma-70 factor, ECF subfamily